MEMAMVLALIMSMIANILKKKFDNVQVMFENVQVMFEKIENDIKEVRSMVNSIPKWFVGLILSVFGIVIAIFMLQSNNLNKLMDTRTELLTLQSRQFDERFDAQNQLFNDKFAAMIKENDKTYQLVLETLKNGN
jgi:NADH:ubiquinone oxidoreductase subunit 5 (subunit L)/multisubunit Na+/H+ antiporter MnhA subunit